MPAHRRIPSYRLHKPSGQAVVRINGRDIYLGVHGTEASRQEYDRIIAEWLASGRTPPRQARSHSTTADQIAGSDLSINELLLAFLEHAEKHYRDPSGQPTGELHNFKDAIRPLKKLYGMTEARKFGPLSLRAVREDMVRSGLTRQVINSRVNRIRRIFKWAVSMELLPAVILEALRSVQGLQQGRTEAREAPGVAPVPVELVEKTIPFATPPVRAMAQLQLLTGARVGEVLVMRTVDIDRTGEVWTYAPHRHKTKYRGRSRVIHLGPKAQEVLRPFLLPQEPQAYIFSPARSTALRNAERAVARKTKRQPSQAIGKRRKTKPERKPADRYTRFSYNRAIARACKKAGVAPWHPLQLRHTRATELRARYGVDAARTILGHSKVETTQIYAEQDLSKAAQIMGEIG